MVWGILSGVGAGWLLGRAGSSGGIEIGTSKKDIKQTDINLQYSPVVYQPFTEITTTTIENSPSASVSTKKTQTPEWSTQMPVSVIPLQSGGSLPQPSGAGVNIWDFVIIAGLGVGAYYIIKKW